MRLLARQEKVQESYCYNPGPSRSILMVLPQYQDNRKSTHVEDKTRYRDDLRN